MRWPGTSPRHAANEMSDSTENFLSRWSRRKRQVRDAEPEIAHASVHKRSSGDRDAAASARQADTDGVSAPDTADATTSKPAGQAPDLANGAGAPEPETAAEGMQLNDPADETPSALDDVDFDRLDYSSDYQRFMSGDVSDETRNKALRKLWVSNPLLANQDGLDDYCEDYTDAAVCLPKGVMKSAYQFGRGFLDDDEVAAWEALGRPTSDDVSDPEADLARSDDRTETKTAESAHADQTATVDGTKSAQSTQSAPKACGHSDDQPTPVVVTGGPPAVAGIAAQTTHSVPAPDDHLIGQSDPPDEKA